MYTICGCKHSKADHNHETDFCKIEGCGCQEFIVDENEWKEAKERWTYEAIEDERLESEAFHQEILEQEDNEFPSDWTDLDNPGGTKFCY